MQDATFVRHVRQGRILGLSGVTERHITLETDPGFRHRWTAMFRAFAAARLSELIELLRLWLERLTRK